MPVWCTAEFDIMMQVSLFSKTYVGADGTCPRPVRKRLSQITSIEVLLATMNSLSRGMRHTRLLAALPGDRCAVEEEHVEREFFIDNLMVRIHSIIVMVLVDQPLRHGILNSLFQIALSTFLVPFVLSFTGWEGC